MKSETSAISVLVADDHTLLVDMIEATLQADGAFVTGRALSLDDAIEEIRKRGHYDIVLLDLDMPGMNGLAGIERAVTANKPGAVVLFSGQARNEAVFKALEIGVRGYIPKTLAAKSLANAIRFIASGEVYFPSAVASGLAQGNKTKKPSWLSPKEFDVLRGISRGDTNKDIARELGMTEITVKMHVRSICAKLNVANRTQIAMTAVTRGLL